MRWPLLLLLLLLRHRRTVLLVRRLQLRRDLLRLAAGWWLPVAAVCRVTWRPCPLQQVLAAVHRPFSTPASPT